MGQLPGLGVFLGHILERELLGLEEGVFIVEGSVLEEFAGGHSQSFGDGFDDVGGGILTALLDVAQVALGHPRLIRQRLQGVIPVRTEPPDGKPYVIGESSLCHCSTPEFEGLPGCLGVGPYVLQCMGWHARMQL